jgi:hypothetical protein
MSISNSIISKAILNLVNETRLQGQITGGGENLAGLPDKLVASSNLLFKHFTSEVQATSRTMRDKMADFINVKDFGAIGNGIANDTAAFREAIEFANGRPVYVPRGEYLITETILVKANQRLSEHTFSSGVGVSLTGAFGPGLHLIGEGMTATVLKCQVPNGPMFDIDANTQVETSPGSGIFTYAYRAQMGVRVERLAVSGLNSIANSTAFKLYNAYQTVFDQVHIRNLTGRGIHLVNGEHPDDGHNMVNITNCWFEAIQTWAIDGTGIPGKNEGSFTLLRHVFIQGCGTNQYFTLKSLSSASQAIASVSLNQTPALGVTATTIPFQPGDRVKMFGIQNMPLANDQIFKVGPNPSADSILLYTNVLPTGTFGSLQTLGTNPLSITNGSNIITVTDTAHGILPNDYVKFNTPVTLGNMTISGTYAVLTVIDADTYTIQNNLVFASSSVQGGTGIQVSYNASVPLDSTTFGTFAPSVQGIPLGNNPLAVTVGLTSAVLTMANHGRAVNDVVFLSGMAALGDNLGVGGVTLNGDYRVTAVTTNTMTIRIPTAPAATATGGGSGGFARFVNLNGNAVGRQSRTLAIGAVATTNTNTAVTFTSAIHEMNVGDTVTLDASITLGGITLAAGDYSVASVPDCNTFTITGGNAATSSATSSATLAVQFLVRTGQPNAEIGYYQPRSGGMRWKGQILKLEQCAFTVNQNCAQFIQGDAGNGVGVICDQVVWENNFRRHLLVTGILNFYAIGSQFHGNDNYRQWVMADFDATTFSIALVQWQNIKVRARLGFGTAFRVIGLNADLSSIRFNGINWNDFDYPRQVRYQGIEFDHVPQTAILRWGSATTMQFAPSVTQSLGKTTPLRRSGPNNSSYTGVPSTSGEWIAYQFTSNNGITLTNAGLSPSTQYQVYLYESSGSIALEASTVAATIDTSHGYKVKTGDASRLWVGQVFTNSSSQFDSTGMAYTNPIIMPGSTPGTPEFLWHNVADRKLYIKTGSAPTSGAGGTYGYWPTFEASGTYDPPSIAAGETVSTTLAGVCALGDYVVGPSFTNNLNGVILHAYISASNVITFNFYNPTGSAIDLASGTLRATYIRR